MLKLLPLLALMSLGVELVIKNPPDVITQEFTAVLFLVPGVLTCFFLKEELLQTYLRLALKASLGFSLIFGLIDALLSDEPYILSLILSLYAFVFHFTGLCLGRLLSSTDLRRRLNRRSK